MLSHMKISIKQCADKLPYDSTSFMDLFYLKTS